MGSCQNYGPFLGTLNNRCRIIIRTQKGTIILTTTQILEYWVFTSWGPGTKNPDGPESLEGAILVPGGPKF